MINSEDTIGKKLLVKFLKIGFDNFFIRKTLEWKGNLQLRCQWNPQTGLTNSIQLQDGSCFLLFYSSILSSTLQCFSFYYIFFSVLAIFVMFVYLDILPKLNFVSMNICHVCHLESWNRGHIKYLKSHYPKFIINISTVISKRKLYFPFTNQYSFLYLVIWYYIHFASITYCSTFSEVSIGALDKRSFEFLGAPIH